VIKRNQCLSQGPAITRLSALGIDDLEKEGYKFKAEDTGSDSVYRLLSINDIPYLSPADRAQLMKENEESVAWFESYQSERTDDPHGASDPRRR
jgi:hypothetical protein